MDMEAGNEQRFVAEVDAFEFNAHDVAPIINSLEDWLAKVRCDLQANRLGCDGLKQEGTLAHDARSINATLDEHMRLWQTQWAHLAPAQSLANRFGDKALFLVFGKFNAGKSSLCNFLAERFIFHGRTVEYFHVDAGEVVTTQGPLTEGVTETTARLQGVILAGKLVLLDSPGLHSVSPENAALTQRFTDSAEGILWLTSSAAPGQVRELDDLGRELHRNKPLLPVLTRSDRYEEDEVEGEIRKVLRNKSEPNRAQQEADVTERAQQKLVSMGVDPLLLKAPVSVSTLMARQNEGASSALAEAGFERLYALMLSVSESALAYKRRKVAEVLLHHLEENVLGSFRREVLPRLAAFDVSLDVALGILEGQLDEIANAVWRGVIPSLTDLLDAHAGRAEYGALLDHLSRMTCETFFKVVGERLTEYDIGSSTSEFQTDFNGSALGNQDYATRHAVAREAIRKCILQLSNQVADQCRSLIGDLRTRSNRLAVGIHGHEQSLLDFKRVLRAEYK